MRTFSNVRTNRLQCTSCRKRLKVGSLALFDLNGRGRMRAVYCDTCAENLGHVDDGDPRLHEHDSNIDLVDDGYGW